MHVDEDDHDQDNRDDDGGREDSPSPSRGRSDDESSGPSGDEGYHANTAATRNGAANMQVESDDDDPDQRPQDIHKSTKTRIGRGLFHTFASPAKKFPYPRKR
eukprot:scaffold83403_cov30-Cyclotella_meneghiniana.AAC.1